MTPGVTWLIINSKIIKYNQSIYLLDLCRDIEAGIKLLCSTGWDVIECLYGFPAAEKR